jgi:hypothetical protein
MMGNMRLNKRKEKFNGGLRNNQMIKKDAQYDAKIIAGHDQSDYLLGIAMKTHIYTEQTI